MQSAESHRFVADGYERAQEGIRAQVQAEFAERLKQATPKEVSNLRRELDREIDARIRRAAPRDALY